jgi:hypothetical protein
MSVKLPFRSVDRRAGGNSKKQGHPWPYRYRTIQCCGSGMFIPDPTFSIPDPGSEFFHSRYRIRIKEFSILTQKNENMEIRKYDPGCSSRIPYPDPYFLPIPDPGSRGQKGSGSQIRNTGTISTKRGGGGG